MTDSHMAPFPEQPGTPEPAQMNKEDGAQMGFLDHLEELRWRLIKVIIAVIVSAGVALIFGSEIFGFIIRPLGDLELHVTTVTGSFYSYLTVSLFAGVVISLPFVFYHLWSFVAPGLYRSESRVVLPAIAFSTVLFLLGAAFCYKIVLPFSIQYLVGFGGDFLTPIITIDSYLSFAGMMMLAFGAGFNMPVVSYFLARLGLISKQTLVTGRRLAIIAILVFSALITPPDIFTQIMLGGPLYLLYEVSILVVALTRRPGETDD
ncbi:MAG: twin-arginine translocase subunit TatC [Candidatus Zixiibacteriota bacterium]